MQSCRYQVRNPPCADPDRRDEQFIDEARNGVVTATALGLPPDLDPQVLRQAMNEAGMADTDLRLRLMDGNTRLCRAQPHVDHDPVSAEDGVIHDRSRDAQQTVEDSSCRRTDKRA
jgi:hypothetical protein